MFFKIKSNFNGKTEISYRTDRTYIYIMEHILDIWIYIDILDKICISIILKGKIMIKYIGKNKMIIVHNKL